jgi:hypothetical protein
MALDIDEQLVTHEIDAYLWRRTGEGWTPWTGRFGALECAINYYWRRKH